MLSSYHGTTEEQMTDTWNDVNESQKQKRGKETIVGKEQDWELLSIKDVCQCVHYYSEHMSGCCSFFFEIILRDIDESQEEVWLFSIFLYFCILFSDKSSNGFPPKPDPNSRNTKPRFFVFTAFILSFHELRL